MGPLNRRLRLLFPPNHCRRLYRYIASMRSVERALSVTSLYDRATTLYERRRHIPKPHRHHALVFPQIPNSGIGFRDFHLVHWAIGIKAALSGQCGRFHAPT